MRKTNISIITIIASLIFVIGSIPAQAGLISEKQELSMGKDASAKIESQYQVSRNTGLNGQVNNIGTRIAAASSRPNLPWHFKVLDVNDINAVSVPAYVYVNRGLMTFVGNDRDALAGVIAHEVAHTAAHHAAKSAEKQLEFSLALTIILKGDGAQQLGNIAANLALLGYSRKDEYEADRLGVDYMVRAGYDPNGMLRFFLALQAKEGQDSKGLSVYFRTHPPTSERIVRVRQEMQKLGIRPTAALPKS